MPAPYNKRSQQVGAPVPVVSAISGCAPVSQPRTGLVRRSLLFSEGGFTLLELLAVITIIITATVIALPAIKALRATSVQIAARQVQNEMMLARQYAITRHTRVIFGIAVDTSGGVSADKVCRAYLICTNNASVGDWSALQGWKFLPEGVVFSDHNVEGGPYNPITLDPVPALGAASVRNLGLASGSSTSWQYLSSTNSFNVAAPAGTFIFSYVEFRPTGFVNMPSSAVTGGIRLMQGMVLDASTRNTVITDTNNWVYIEYDQYGRVRTRYRDSYK